MLHEQVQYQILDICTSLGLSAQTEYRGNGWRADVFVPIDGRKYAFEVQLSPQSLKKTQERQAKYIRDGVVGCWLFEKEPARQKSEMEDLPIFKLEFSDNKTFVSLKKRKILSLEDFVHDFLYDKIKFCHTLTPLPFVEIYFLEMRCWKCGAINHIYYVAPFQSSCNTIINYEEAMWVSDKLVFHPFIISKIQDYANLNKYLNLAIVKPRYSHTVGDSYMSFGCHKCDSIFGDWYVQNAVMDSWNGEGIIDKFKFKVDFDLNLKHDIPHWCHPGEHNFCE